MGSDRHRSRSPAGRSSRHDSGSRKRSHSGRRRSRSRSKDRRRDSKHSSRGGRSKSRSKSPHGRRSSKRSKSRSRSPVADRAKRSSSSREPRARSPDKRRSSRERRHRSSDRERSRAGREGSRGKGSDRDSRGRRESSRDRDRDRDRQQDRDHKRSRWEPEGQSPKQQQLQQYPGPPPQQQQPPGQSRWDHGGAGGGGGSRDWQQQQQQQLGSPRGGGGAGPGFRRAPMSEEPPAVGSIHRGSVAAIKPFGVFVALEGFRKHALVHHSQVSSEVVLTRSDEDELKVKALEFAAPVGQQAWVKILEVSPDQSGPGFRVHGSMRVVDQADGSDLDPSGQLAAARGPGGGGGRLSDEPPEVGSCHRGEVKRVEAYGVFVALAGFRKYGLVHASQVANYLEFSAEDGEAERKAALGEVAALGQEVWVKVVEVGEDARGPKIGCSMKLVDQSDGTDLDPQGLRYRPRGEAGPGGGPGGRAPIGATAGEVRGGAVDWGYLATRPDAFGSSGYDLLGDEPREPQQQQQQQAAGGGRGFPPPPQQQQQQQRLPPVGRGRGAVVPAWMTSGVGTAAAAAAPAAPGSQPNTAAVGGVGGLTVEEALRIVNAAAGGKHKKSKEKKHKHKKSSKHKKSGKEKKHRRRSRSAGGTSGSSSDSSSGDSGRR